MTVLQLIRVAVLVSIMLIVLSFALRATWRDATSLFRNPWLLLRSLLAMNVLMPIFAATLVGLFTLRPAIAIALLSLAVSPVPPFLPRKQIKVAGEREYVHGLLGATSLLCVVIAPVTVVLIGLAFLHRVDIEPLKIARMVGLTVLIPFALGLIINHLRPPFADRASPIAGKAGVLLLLAAGVPVLIKMWPAMISLIGDGTLLAIVAFVAVGLAMGHLLGGPDSGDRAVLALATATRHPGVALVIASGTVAGDKVVAPAVLLYLLVGTIASTPYVMWRRRQRVG
ncbi:MAG: bile acid:sodium symporter family protein [Steroidobacteraceae bacterium]